MNASFGLSNLKMSEYPYDVENETMPAKSKRHPLRSVEVPIGRVHNLMKRNDYSQLLVVMWGSIPANSSISVARYSITAAR